MINKLKELKKSLEDRFDVAQITIGFDAKVASFQVVLVPEQKDQPNQVVAEVKDFDLAKTTALELAKEEGCRVCCHTSKPFTINE